MKTALQIVMKQLMYADNVRTQTADLPGAAVQSFQYMPDRTIDGTRKQAYILDCCIDGKQAEQGAIVTIRCQIAVVLVLLTLPRG